MILIIKKNSYEKLLTQFNDYAEKLKFTVEKMKENRLNFLDVTLEIKDSKLMMWNYSKPQNRSKITDYKFETAPLSQKIGTLCTEIYRMNSTTNNSESLDLALQALTQKFLNSYACGVNTYVRLRNVR